jgi:predicted ATPase/DNA-binding CsgD family transcriptional regulator
MDARPPRQPEPAHNLPTLLTSFVGREGEAADVARLLGERRLVTLVGAPGVGKTRLALRVASDLIPGFPHGVWLVELAALADPALVSPSVATALDIREQPGVPVMASLADALRSRELLLVLDNCEHLVDACAALAETLLRACVRLRILATSRESLRIEGETSWRVPSLAVSDQRQYALDPAIPLAHLLAYPATRLFVERARASSAAFDPNDRDAGAIVSICRRLDGIPLAIELAAARVRSLPPVQVAARLEDSFALLTGGSRTALPRHQTLRAALDWSHDLLTEPERKLLRQLSVFAGGWTIEAAQSVCDLGADGLLDLLRLVDRSLVQVEASDDGETRYRLLEPIRQYAAEQLCSAGEDSVIRGRHLAWCVTLAEEADVWGSDAVAWTERLLAEHDNLRAALAWSLADGTEAGSDTGIRLAVAVENFWFVRDFLIEGRRWLEQLLAVEDTRGRADRVAENATGAAAEPVRSRDSLGKHPRVAALNALSMLEYQQQEHDAAAAHVDEALELAHRVQDRVGIGHALNTLGTLVRARGEYGRSVALLEESVSLFKSVGDPFGMWRAPNQLGETLTMLGELERARRLHEESLAVARSMDWPWRVAHVLRNLALVAYRQGDLDRASTLLQESLARWRDVGATRGPQWALAELGHVALAQDDRVGAAACFRESLALCREAGDRRGVARCLEGLAAASGDDPDETWARRAARLLGKATDLREATGVPVSPLERPTHERATADARARLGEEAFATALLEGRALPTHEAIEIALAARQSDGRMDDLKPGQSAADASSPLSRREREVVPLIARGLTNRQIAARLVISERTVDGHVAKILSKLGFATRAQIAVWADRHGLTPSDD